MSEQEIIAQLLEVIKTQLVLDTTPRLEQKIEDLEMDDLDKVDLIMAIEDEFNIEIPYEEFEKFKDINDIAKHIIKDGG